MIPDDIPWFAYYLKFLQKNIQRGTLVRIYKYNKNRKCYQLMILILRFLIRLDF